MKKEELKKCIMHAEFFDIPLIKLSVFFFTLFIASYISKDLLIKYRFVWILGFLIFAIRPFWRLVINCGKKNDKK